VIAVVGYNDAFVMSAWSKANGIKNDEILFLSDDEAKFSKSIGWTMGLRLARYAIVLDKGKVVYCGKDEPGKLEVCMRECMVGMRLIGIGEFGGGSVGEVVGWGVLRIWCCYLRWSTRGASVQVLLWVKGLLQWPAGKIKYRCFSSF